MRSPMTIAHARVWTTLVLLAFSIATCSSTDHDQRVGQQMLFEDPLVRYVAPSEPLSAPTASPFARGVTPENPFTDLASALAGTPDKGTLKIAPGRYTGPGNFNLTIGSKALTITSTTSQRDAVVIDCGDASEGSATRGFSIMANPDLCHGVHSGCPNGPVPGLEITMSSITFTRCNRALVIDHYTVQLDDMRFMANGQVIGATFSAVSMAHSLVDNNVLSSKVQWRGVASFLSVDTYITDTIFRNNTRYSENLKDECVFAMIPEQDTRFVVEKSVFDSNSFEATAKFSDLGNHAPTSGEGILTNAGIMGVMCVLITHKLPNWAIRIRGNRFISNLAPEIGAILALNQVAIPGCQNSTCITELSDNVFIGNHGQSAVVSLTQQSYQVSRFTAFPDIMIKGSSFTNNTSSYGGVISSKEASPSLYGCSFYNNHLIPSAALLNTVVGWNLNIDGRGNSPNGPSTIQDCVFDDPALDKNAHDANSSPSVLILGTAETLFKNCSFRLASGPMVLVSGPTKVTFEGGEFILGPGNFRGLQSIESSSPTVTGVKITAQSRGDFHGKAVGVSIPAQVFGTALVFLASESSAPVLSDLTVDLYGYAGFMGAESLAKGVVSNTVVRGHNSSYILTAFSEGQDGLTFTDCEFSGEFRIVSPFLLKYATSAVFESCHFHNISVYDPLNGTTPAVFDTVSDLIDGVSDFHSFNQLHVRNCLFENNHVTPMWIGGTANLEQTTFRHNRDMYRGPQAFRLHAGANIDLTRTAACGNDLHDAPAANESVAVCPTDSHHNEHDVGEDTATVSGGFSIPFSELSGCHIAYKTCNLKLDTKESLYLCDSEPFTYSIGLTTSTIGVLVVVKSNNPLATVTMLLSNGTHSMNDSHALFDLKPYVWQAKDMLTLNLTYDKHYFFRGNLYNLTFISDFQTNLSIETMHWPETVCEWGSELKTTERFFGMATTFPLRDLNIVAVLKNQFNDRLLARENPGVYLRAVSTDGEMVIEANTSQSLLDAEFLLRFDETGTYDIYLHAPVNYLGMNVNQPLLRVRLFWVGWVYISIGVLVALVTAAIGFCVSRTWRKKAAELRDVINMKQIQLEDATRGGPAEIQKRYLEQFEQGETPAVVVFDEHEHLHVLCEAPGYWHTIEGCKGYEVGHSSLSPASTSLFIELQRVFEETGVALPGINWMDLQQMPPALYDSDIPPSALIDLFLPISTCRADKYYSRHKFAGLNHAVLPDGQTLWVCDEHLATLDYIRHKYPFDLVPGVRNMMNPVGDSSDFFELEIPSPNCIPPSSPAHTIVSLIRRELARTPAGKHMTVTRIRLMQSRALENVFRDRLALLQSGDRRYLARAWPDRAKSDREVIMKEVCRHTSRFKSDDVECDAANLDLVWHGAMDGENAIRNICRLGFLNLARLNTGYHGRGAYFTHYPDYAEYYGSSGGHRPVPTEFGEGVLLLSWALLGQTYPVTERMDRVEDPEHMFHSGYPGHDSHAALVEPGGLPCKNYEERRFTYDEVVIWQENQILPCFIVYYRNETGDAGTN